MARRRFGRSTHAKRCRKFAPSPLTQLGGDTDRYHTSDHQLAWDTDVTPTWHDLSVWAQYIDSHGVLCSEIPTEAIVDLAEQREAAGLRFQAGSMN